MTRGLGINPRDTLSLMKIVVRLFAGLREQAGTKERTLKLPAGSTVASVWPALALGEEPPGLLIAVNRAYADRDAPLEDGDEVAMIPPVSGGGPFLISADPLSLEAAVAEVSSVEAGAVATFIGTTRAHSKGRDVLRLEYEAYEEMAIEEMGRLASVLHTQYDLVGLAIHHRTGVVEPGEASVIIAASATHRADALAAVKDAIDTLKQTVPLWKKEFYGDGSVWVGSEADYQRELREEERR